MSARPKITIRIGRLQVTGQTQAEAQALATALAAGLEAQVSRQLSSRDFGQRAEASQALAEQMQANGPLQVTAASGAVSGPASARGRAIGTQIGTALLGRTGPSQGGRS